MAEFIDDVRLFTGGMDQDSPDEFIAADDYRSLLNARNKFGRVTSLKGTTDINASHATNPTFSSNNTVLYSCDDIENNAIVLFIHSTVGSGNAIYRLWTDTGTLEPILIDTLLDFSKTTPVKSAELVDDTLIWTDGSRYPIRAMNIKKASDYSLTAHDPSGATVYQIGDFMSRTSNRYRCKSANTSGAYSAGDWVLERVIDAYTEIDLEMLEYIKYSPSIDPEVTYYSDANYASNFLNGKQFQFAYRYIHDDYGKTVTSPYSKIEVPPEELFANNQPNVDYLNNNRMYLFLKTGHLLVQRIELLVREGNNGSWFSYDTIDKYDSDGSYATIDTFTGDTNSNIIINSISAEDIAKLKAGMYISHADFSADVYIVEVFATSITVSDGATGSSAGETINIVAHPNVDIPYSFYNDKAPIALDQTDVSRPYDYIPPLADNITAFENTRVGIANYTEGFDNVDIDVSLGYTEEAIDTHAALQDSTDFSVATASLTNYKTYFYTQNGANVVSVGDLLTLTIVLSGEDVAGDLIETETYTFNFTVEADDLSGTYPDDLFVKMAAVMEKSSKYETLGDFDSSKRFSVVADTSTLKVYVNRTIEQDSVEYEIDTSNMLLTMFVAKGMPTYKNWRVGEKFFGIEYGDQAGRFGTVNTSPESKIEIPSYDDQSLGTMYNYMKIDWAIDKDFQPPDWAYYWRWVYYDSTPVAYTQFKFTDWRIDDGGKTRIKFDQYINIFNDQNPNAQVDNYVYQEGDVFKILAYWSSGTPTWIPLFINIEGNIIGGENDDDGIYEIIVDNMDDLSNTDSLSTALYFIGEAYTPKKELETKVYREIGKSFNVGDPTESTRYHQSDESQGAGWADQSLSSSDATGIFLSGDSYYGYRQDFIQLFPCARKNLSDFYPSENYDYGRLNAVDKDALEFNYKNRIRYSGRYIDGTVINNIATYDFDDYVTLSDKFGAIVKMIEVGDTLKIIQEHKENSAYIGKSQLTQSTTAGQDLVVASDVVLGIIVAYEDDYGCQDARTIVKHNRYLYYLDKSKGLVIRSAPNGQFKISDYKMERYFKTKCQSLRESVDTVNIFASLIDEENEYVLTFMDGSTSDNVVFNEDMNRWTHKLNMSMTTNVLVEHTAALGQKLFSFMRGTAWRHEDNSTYNYLFGEQRDQEIQFVANKDFIKNKVFLAITLHTDNNVYDKSDDTTNWSVPTITIPSSAMYPSGMSSLLTAVIMEYREGKVHSKFLGDANTPNMTGKNAYINGRALRGKMVDITMQNTKTTEVNLVSVVVRSNYSELNSP